MISKNNKMLKLLNTIQYLKFIVLTNSQYSILINMFNSVLKSLIVKYPSGTSICYLVGSTCTCTNNHLKQPYNLFPNKKLYKISLTVFILKITHDNISEICCLLYIYIFFVIQNPFIKYCHNII